MKVAPVVIDDAVNVSLVLIQVRVVGAAILTLGGVIVCVTVTKAVFVQPFEGSVTVAV